MIFFYLSLACTDGTHKGTIIGNPGDGKGKLADSERVLIHDAVLVDPSLSFRNDGDVVFVDTERDWDGLFDLLDDDYHFTVPAGTWQSLYLESEELFIAGEIETSEGWIDFELDLQIDIPLDGQQSFTIDGQNLIFELGQPNWLTEELLLPIIEENEDEEESFAALESISQRRSGFYHDVDGDGEIDTEEREQPVAYTEEVSTEIEVDETETVTDDASEENTDASGDKESFSTGCSDSTVQIALLPILALGLQRRRRKIHTPCSQSEK